MVILLYDHVLCIGFVLSKYDIAKSTLINHINDKCANARRIYKKKPKE